MIDGGEPVKEVLLSHDAKVLMYCVPDPVAEDLEKYCLDFACHWIWENPNGAKLLQNVRGMTVAVYGAPDFIDYLNQWVFPEQQSSLIRQLDYYIHELPEEYQKYPQFNF